MSTIKKMTKIKCNNTITAEIQQDFEKAINQPKEFNYFLKRALHGSSHSHMD